MSNASYAVYKHTVPNGKVYIGITCVNPLDRWKNGHGYKPNKPFWNDIVLYGWLNIKHEILYSGLTEREARNVEARLICECQSYKRKYGYNVQAGYVYGYIIDAHGYDYRNIMDREEYLLYCKSDEYKKACIPKQATCKKVYQYSINGDYIKTYLSIGDAARQLKVDKKNIKDCLKGKQKTCKGFIFRPSPSNSAEGRKGTVGGKYL